MRIDPVSPRLTRTAAFASLASGAALLAAPRPIGDLYGISQSRTLRRWLGVRDLVIGVGLLRAERARAWWVARAASDAVDTLLIVERGLARPSALTPLRIAGGIGLAIAGFWIARAHRSPPEERSAAAR